MRAIKSLLLAPILLVGCATGPEGEAPRPFVIGSGRQVASLWWRGELTDTRGNLWNVALIPGIAPSLEAGVEGWKDALDFASDPAEAEFWGDRADDVGDGLEFAGEDVLHDFFARGLADDFKGAREGVASNVRETPFGWIPRALGHVAWGFLIKPAGRIALTPVGVAGGLAWSIVTPVAHVVARPVGGATWGVVAGTVQPVARLAVHPPVFALALANREPAVRHDGSFGLSILSSPDAGGGEPQWIEEPPPAPRPFVELVAEQQAAVLAKLEEQDRAALDERLGERRRAVITESLAEDPTAWRASWEAWLREVDPEGRAGDVGEFERLLLRHAEQR